MRLHEHLYKNSYCRSVDLETLQILFFFTQSTMITPGNIPMVSPSPGASHNRHQIPRKVCSPAWPACFFWSLVKLQVWDESGLDHESFPSVTEE